MRRRPIRRAAVRGSRRGRATAPRRESASSLHGEIRGNADFTLQESAGRRVLNFVMQAGHSDHVFTATRDLLDFKFFVTAASDRTEITLDRLDLIQEA
jgi:hypothetical protein